MRLEDFVYEVMRQLRPFLAEGGIVHFEMNVREAWEGNKVYIIPENGVDAQHISFDVPVKSKNCDGE